MMKFDDGEGVSVDASGGARTAEKKRAGMSAPRLRNWKLLTLPQRERIQASSVGRYFLPWQSWDKLKASRCHVFRTLARICTYH